MSAPRWAPLLAPFGAGESPRFGLGQGGGRAVPGRVTTRRPRQRSDRQHPVPAQHAGSAASPKTAGWAASGPHLAEREQCRWLPHGRARAMAGAGGHGRVCAPRLAPLQLSPFSLAGPGPRPRSLPGGAVPRPAGGCQPRLRGVHGLCLHKPFPLPARLPARSTPRHRRQLTPAAPARRVPLPAGAPHHPGKAGKSGVL